jgi:hypothetical protein
MPMWERSEVRKTGASASAGRVGWGGVAIGYVLRKAVAVLELVGYFCRTALVVRNKRRRRPIADY